MKVALVSILLSVFTVVGFSQQVPSEAENIDFICTFGDQTEATWGDDDHVQVFFFLVPKNNPRPFFLRIFDPEIGGLNDQVVSEPVTGKSTFSVIGGKGCYSEPDAREYNLKGNYRSGSLLKSITFEQQTKFDNDWFAMGPFNPSDGEYVKEFDSYVFKIISEVKGGDDGNLYKYFFSTEKVRNISVEGANVFTYKYTFRLKPAKYDVAHLYPLIDENTVSIRQYNFDFDYEGSIKAYSVSKNGLPMKMSGDGDLATSEHPITFDEKGKSINIQIVKSKNRLNDMTFYILNQYDKAIPFFAIPIGGVPKYKFKVELDYDYVNKKRSMGN